MRQLEMGLATLGVQKEEAGSTSFRPASMPGGRDRGQHVRGPAADSSRTCVRRKLLPDGSRNPRVDPVRALLGRLGELDAAALELLVVGWQSSVVRNTVPAKPFAISALTCSAVSASITGGPGIAISTIAMSG